MSCYEGNIGAKFKNILMNYSMVLIRSKKKYPKIGFFVVIPKLLELVSMEVRQAFHPFMLPLKIDEYA